MCIHLIYHTDLQNFLIVPRMSTNKWWLVFFFREKYAKAFCGKLAISEYSRLLKIENVQSYFSYSLSRQKWFSPISCTF